MKLTKNNINESVIDKIVETLNRGLSAEVKRERDNVVVVELKRRAIIKQPINDNSIKL